MNRAVLALPLLAACSGGVNIFSLEDDIQLGADLHAEILANPSEYPLLDPAEYPDAYAHLDRIQQQLLDSGAVAHADDFEWQTYIIHDDDTLNAFAAPGGYIYIYSGLINYLDEEDHFAGVFAHEMAHVDRRHATQRLTKVYGLETLLGVALGEDPGLLGEIAVGLVSLKFSRNDEFEADEYSVRTLCSTAYAGDGTAGFFEKLLVDSEGGMDIALLSTHPTDEDRVDAIDEWIDVLGCDTTPNPDGQWAELQASLP